jgi:O-antigen ligase
MQQASNFYTRIRKLIFANKTGLIGLFSFATVILFAKLASSSDFSKIAWITVLLGLAAAWRNSKLNLCYNNADNKFTFIFLTYAALAFISCIMNPEYFDEYKRICLWAACLISGYILACLIPNHRYAFLRGTIAVIFLGAAILLPLYYMLGEEQELFRAYRLELLTGHPSRLALYCTVSIFYTLYEWQQRSGPTRKILFAITVGLLCIMYFTNARAVILFALISILIYGLMLNRKQAVRIIALSVIGTIIISGLVFFNRNNAPSKRFLSAISDIRSDATFQSRLPIWEVGIWAFQQSPWFGNGIFSYKGAHKEYQQRYRHVWNKLYPGYEKNVDSAHNIILGRLVDTGILGTIAFLTLYIMALRRALLAPAQDRWIAAFLIFYLLIGLVDDPLKRINDSFIFFLIGITIGRSIEKSDDSLKTQAVHTPRKRSISLHEQAHPLSPT